MHVVVKSLFNEPDISFLYFSLPNQTSLPLSQAQVEGVKTRKEGRKWERAWICKEKGKKEQLSRENKQRCHSI